METQITEFITEMPSDSYQLIKDEHLSMVVVTSQVLTSCSILLSTYNQVVFSECTFYACSFKGIDFDGCVFENCTFEFSHFRKCNFKNCSFINCNFVGVSSIHSVYEACDLNNGMNLLCRNGKNTITSGKRDHSTDIYIELALAS